MSLWSKKDIVAKIINLVFNILEIFEFWSSGIEFRGEEGRNRRWRELEELKESKEFISSPSNMNSLGIEEKEIISGIIFEKMRNTKLN